MPSVPRAPVPPTAPVAPSPPDTASPPRGHDGVSPFPPDGPAPDRDGGQRLYVAVTAVIVVLPFVALGLPGRLLWGRLIHPAVIRLLERPGWVYDVRRPTPDRAAARRA
ncbi:hypothetical protein ABT075_32945 [Streptomyces sp. NPDC002677]|uniref:hypothetical protein n=1 Tax=Streptomyces sp. NPDC002677 TaxID=3154774 RepID=UPI00333148B5